MLGAGGPLRGGSPARQGLQPAAIGGVAGVERVQIDAGHAGERGEGTDDYAPARGPGVFGELRRGAGDFGQDPLGVQEERFARRCRAHAATAAIEEFDAKFALQQADLLREGGLRDADRGGGAGEMALAGDGGEVAELA